jgi:type IV pilus assembly protein PilM
VSDSIWKREISFRRAPTHEVDVAPDASSFLEKQLAFQRRLEEAAAGAPQPAEATKPQASAAPVEPAFPPDVVEAPVAGEQSTFRKEISFRRKGSVEHSTPPGESIWKKEITFRRKHDAPRSDSIWNKEISLRRRAARQAQIERLAVAALERIGVDPDAEADAAADPWLDGPELPSATEPAATPEPKQSRWKRERSIRKPKRGRDGKKKDHAADAKPKRRERAASKPARTGRSVKRLVGLKIGASQLAAARVANNGAAELVQLARQPLEHGIVVGGEVRDPEALAEALKRFFAKNKLPKKNVRLGIASNRIGVRTFDLVGIEDEKRLENAIRFRAQEALPIPIDEAVLDYRLLSESVNDEGATVQRVLLVVAYRELVDRYVSACKKAGITLAGVDLEAFALLRAVAAPRPEDVQPEAALVAVAIGHDRSTFAVSDGRTCEFTRVIEWGGSTLNVAIARALDLAPSEVETVKRLVSLEGSDTPEGLEPEKYTLAVDAVRKQVQAFARELVSSLQFYQHQPGSLGIGEIIITGGSAGIGGLAPELERVIGVRVRVGDPLARMKVPKKLAVEDQIGSLAIALGLGIED